jgi:hypothetical protein
VNLSDKAQRGLAELMVGALKEMSGRKLSETSDLEHLGLLGMRLLFSSGALQEKFLMDEALKVASETDIAHLGGAKNDLAKMFLTDDWAEFGITFHSLQ